MNRSSAAVSPVYLIGSAKTSMRASQQPRALTPRGFELLLFALAILFLGVWCWARLDASVFESLQARHLDRILGRVSLKSALLAKAQVAKATRREAAASGLVGRIEIPRLRVEAIVAEGASPLVLRRAVGHLSKTAFPGEPGNVVIAGHRDSFFSSLEEVRPGDRVRITTPDGVFDYSVDTKSVIRPDQTEVLTATDVPTLTLITCYPFRYLGPAPKRFVARAREVALHSGK